MRKFLEQALHSMGSAHEARWIEEFLERQGDLTLSAAQKIVQRRLQGEPLAYIFGSWAFREFEFKCGPGVLIPRPETEELVELALNWVKKNPRLKWDVADFGAGTGCLGLSVALGIKKIFPTAQISLKLIENSAQALPYLKANVEQYLSPQLGISCEIVESHWKDWAWTPLDLFLSNPPYLRETEFQNIDAGVSKFEPKQALVPVEDAMGYECYRQLLSLAQLCLSQAEASLVVFELGTFQANWILKEAALLLPRRTAHIEKDMAGKDRFFLSESIL